MAYVLTKTIMTMKDSSLESLEVMPVRRVGQEWRLALRQDLKLITKVFDEAA